MISLIIKILIDFEKNNHIEMKPVGNSWVPANPMDTGLGKISNPSWVRVFLMGVDIFHGYGFGMAKPSGFATVAISTCSGICPTAS
jgi:hypothetical protein